MVTTASLHAQSVADLGRSLSETIDRVGRSDQPEVITVDGKPTAVLLSVTAYQELIGGLPGGQPAEVAEDELTDEDLRVMRRSIEQYERGEYMEAGVFFDQLHARLLAMQAKQDEP